MKRCFSLGCLGALVILTLLNAWLQFHVHGNQLLNLRDEQEAVERTLRRELELERKRLQTCTASLKESKHKEQGRGNEEQNSSDVVRQSNWKAEREELFAERAGLVRDVRECRNELEQRHSTFSSAADVSCPERLSLAIHQLQRVRAIARARALDAQAANARRKSSTLALSSRLRVAHTKLVAQFTKQEELIKMAVAKCEHGEKIEKKGEKQLSSYLKKKVSKFGKFLQRNPFEESKSDNDASDFSYARRRGKSQEPHAIGESIDEDGSGASCVAAVVPFRGRGVHLDLFYQHISKFIELEQSDGSCWSIYIVEQYDAGLFNRGWLFNVGASMAGLEHRKFKCIVIQDLDTLPELGASVNFSDCDMPLQLSSEIQCYGWLPPYAFNAGGVVTVSAKHWYDINGFSNEYVGWGGEDDDFKLRLQALDLLNGTCGDFCDLADRAFRPGQEGLIRRPKKGSGRFICLDEGSHTPRKHGDMKQMHSKLREMEAGSDRWAYDGFSSLRFKLIQHDRMPFPNTTRNVQLHWLKVASDEKPKSMHPSSSALAGLASARFEAKRLRLVLAGNACSRTCADERRCSAFPSKIPFTIAELQQEFMHALGDCWAMDRESAMTKVGFWLIDQELLVTALDVQADAKDGQNWPSIARSPSSWALSEILREALDRPVDGEPVLVIRAVPETQRRISVALFRSNLAQQQKPIIDICTGTFRLDDYRLGSKQTVNVGSDDCEQRSWTHEFSFKALRRPRTPEDQAVCVGEANGVWTARVDLKENCEGEALGVNWTHKAVFFIGKDATGVELCVQHRREQANDLKAWSRWQVRRAKEGKCPPSNEKWTHAFSFRSMEDYYEPARTWLCADSDEGRLRLLLGCKNRGFDSYAVLRARHAQELNADIYQICSSLQGDTILPKAQGCRDINGQFLKFVAEFAIPTVASGNPWCIGYHAETNSSLNNSAQLRQYRVAPMADCRSIQGVVHTLGLREFSLEDVPEKLGLLSLASVL